MLIKNIYGLGGLRSLDHSVSILLASEQYTFLDMRQL